MSDKFEVLTDREHTLQRAGMYIGSQNYKVEEGFIDGEWRSFSTVQGVVKIINEIIDNSVDEALRTNFKYADKVDISIYNKKFSVSDNGRGIPVEIYKNDHVEEYQPVLCWGYAKAGSNFTEDRVGAGANGVGSFCCNVMCKNFKGVTSDGKNRLIFTSQNNASVQSHHVSKSKTRGTSVECFPDFEQFECDEITEDMILEVRERVLALAATYPEIKFTFTTSNGSEKMQFKNIGAYLKRFSSDGASFISNNLIFAIQPSNSDDFRIHSIVNGLYVPNGGSHIDTILGGVIAELRTMIKKKYKFDVLPAQIKQHLQFISIIRGMKGLKFDSQTKTSIENSKKEIDSFISSCDKSLDYSKLAKTIMSTPTIIDPIIELQLAKKIAQEKRDATLAANKLKKKNVAKHIKANKKGGTLFIVEGDSAVGLAVQTRDADTQGFYPLRGKIKNTWGMKTIEILKNEILADLVNILDLNGECDFYYDIGIMTDADVDGQGSISPLLLLFFSRWENLFHEKRISIVKSPIVIATKKRCKTRIFYNMSDFKKSFDKNQLTGFDIKYIKGLGSLTSEAYEQVIKNPVKETVIWDDEAGKYLDLMFSKDKNAADRRKEFLMGDTDETNARLS